MRCTQEAGLRQEAKEFLDQQCLREPTNFCKHCGKPNGETVKRKVYDDSRSSGMFEDGPLLYEYELKDGTKVKEVVQANPWSSGPVIFLCLEREDKTRIGEWPDEDIDNV